MSELRQRGLPEPQDLSKLISLAHSMPDLEEKLEEIRKEVRVLQEEQAETTRIKEDLRAYERQLADRKKQLDLKDAALKSAEASSREQANQRLQEIATSTRAFDRRKQEIKEEEAALEHRKRLLDDEARGHYEYHRQKLDELESTRQSFLTRFNTEKKHAEDVLARREHDVKAKEEALEGILMRLRAFLNDNPPSAYPPSAAP